MLTDDRHPRSLGRPATEVLADVWGVVGGHFDEVFNEGQAVNAIDTLLVRHLGGQVFDSYWSYALLPIASEDGTIGGILAQVRESTQFVQRGRRDALMLRLAERLRQIGDPTEILQAALEIAGEEVDASRLGWAEVDADGGTIAIPACLARHGASDLSGVYPLTAGGDGVYEELAAGHTVRIDDLAASDRFADPEVKARYEQAGIAAILCVPIVSGDGARAMLFAHHHQPKHWTDHQENVLRQATGHVWREVSRARAEAAVRRSEERYRRIFEQANDIIVTATLDQVITDCNPAAAAAIGYARHEIVGRSMADFLAPGMMDQARRMLDHKMDEGGTTNHELVIVSRSGKHLDWEINSTLTLDEAGRPVGLHAIARDVTERRRAEERQRLLVNELNHRVKNTLALVQGLALQSFKSGRDMAEARDAFQHRLAALASAHDLLTRESWEGATLGELMREALALYDGGEDRIRWHGPFVRLNPKAAVSLVMALHELSTNAAKYGALSVPEGRVEVSWSVKDDLLSLEWRESGGPPVTPPDHRGFGFRMIERALAADMSGAAALDFEPGGLVCRIQAALDAAAPAPAAASA
jgi:PAS domain S-box-containing protein